MMLPEGIPDRWPVMVVAVMPENRQIEVINEAGDRWVIGWDVIQFPLNYRFPDSRREFTAWHPRVRAVIQRNLEINQADFREHCQEQHRLAAVRSLQWQLERSSKPHPLAGRKVPKRPI